MQYRWTDLPWLTATAVVYALCAKVTVALFTANGLVSVFWPSAGVSLAVLLLGGTKFSAAIYVGAMASQLWTGESLGVAAVISLGSVLEPLLGVWLLSRKGDFDASLPSSRDFFRLCYLAGALSPAVCALTGVGVLLLSGRIAANDSWYELVRWWMGDTLGIVIVAPLLMVWRRLPRRPWKVIETIVVFALSALVGQTIFLDWFRDELGHYRHGYWMYLIVSWAAVRLGPHGVLLVILIAILQMFTGVAQGLGLFANDMTATNMTNAWTFAITLTMVGTSLAIAFAERDRITTQLRSSENLYSTLFENMLDGLAHCRMIFRNGVPVDYMYVAVNPAFEKMSGLKDVVGRKVSDIIPKYARDNHISLQTFGRVVLTGEPERSEHYLAALNKWFSFAVYRPAAGEFVIISEDVTKRKQADDKVRKLSLAVEQSPVSIVITDPDGRIEYVNPAFSLASGYSAAEAIGRNPRLLKSSRTPPEIYEELWATLVAGKIWRGEFINRRKDGSDYLEAATISPLRRADGQVTHYVGVKTDITELKQAITDLKASEDRLQLAKAAAGLAIFDRNIISGTCNWDERARQFWGVGPDEPISFDTFLAGVHPDDRAATQAAINRALDPQGSGQYAAEYRVVSRADGSTRDIAASGQAFFAGRRALRIVGTMKDISARKRLEKELQERRSQMEQLVKKQVAAQTAVAIAHELNQPLVSISAYSEAALRMLRDGAMNPEKLSRALAGAMEQSQRAGRTLHELLDFLHDGDAASEPIDLNDVVLEAFAIAEEGGYGGFRPVFDLEQNPPPVLANRVQLQKVLVNLLHNGVESMRDAGVTTPSIIIMVRTMTGRNMVQVTLQDSGPGLDAETAQRVFEPFFTTKSDGLGLGLAISRALIETHGGQLWVEPDTGGGAIFHFALPFAT